MPAELYALLTAATLGFGGIAARRGIMVKQNSFGALPTIAIGAAIMWIIVVMTRAPLPSADAAWLHVVRGIIDPGVGALLIFLAFKKIGVAYTIPILAGAPLIATTLSVLFLGEQLTAFIITGTILIIMGVSFLTLRHAERNQYKYYFLAAFGGAMAIGLGTVITKLALTQSNATLSGIAISFTAGTLVHSAVITVTGSIKQLPRSTQELKWFSLSGIAAATGFIFSFTSISQGMVSVVLPLQSTQPFFTLLYTPFFLKQHEKVTLKIVVGAILIVLGAAALVF